MTTPIPNQPKIGSPPSAACIALLYGGLAAAGVVLVCVAKQPLAQVLALLLILAVLATAFATCLTGHSYTAASDVLGHPYKEVDWLLGNNADRGAALAPMHQDELVRTMYQFASYESVRTQWPVMAVFSFCGAVVTSSLVGAPDDWLRTLIISFVIMVLTQTLVHGFALHHGVAQAQMYRDSLYCAYRELRAKEGERRATEEAGSSTEASAGAAASSSAGSVAP